MLKQYQCEGKQRYDTFTKANKIAKNLRRRGAAKKHHVVPYPCKYCNEFHIGGRFGKVI